MDKRIQTLEEIILGKVNEESIEGELRGANLQGGLNDRVNQLEAKIT